MCIKKNNPGCDPCEPCELTQCESGSLTGVDIEVSGIPATRQLTIRSGFTERRVTWSGFDILNGLYSLEVDEDCNYLDTIIDFDVTVTWGINRTPDDPCDCLDYDEEITCVWPYRASIGWGGFGFISIWDGFEAICESGTLLPNSQQFNDMLWETAIARNGNWCSPLTENLTLSGGICFSDCGDTAVGITVEWTPVITP